MIAAIAFAVHLQAHKPVDLVSLVGKPLATDDQAEAVAGLIDRTFSNRIEPNVEVFRRGDGFVVVGELERSIQGFNYPPDIGVYLLSKDQRPISSATFHSPGLPVYEMVNLPRVSDNVLKVSDGKYRTPRSWTVYVAFAGDRPATIRLETGESQPGPWTIGRSIPIQVDSQESVLSGLKDDRPVRVLETLNWLIEPHARPSLTRGFYYETTNKVVRYWSALFSPAIRSQLDLLSQSQEPWIASGARQALEIPPPSSLQSSDQDRIATMGTEDVRVGLGTEWQPGSRVFAKNDCGFFQIDAKLPDGRPVSFGTESLVMIQAGSPFEIAGLQNGLIGMRPGGERCLTLPASMVLGDAGGDQIPPGSGLIVDAKLLYIKDSPIKATPVETHDLLVGAGRAAKVGDWADFTWSCEGLDGKPIEGYASEETMKDRYLMNGVSQAVIGMKLGGIRRVLLHEEALHSPKYLNMERVVVQVRLNKLRPGSAGK